MKERQIVLNDPNSVYPYIKELEKENDRLAQHILELQKEKGELTDKIADLEKKNIKLEDQNTKYSPDSSLYTASGAQVQPAPSGATLHIRCSDQLMRSDDSHTIMDLLPVV